MLKYQGLTDADFDIESVPARLIAQGDPWADILDRKNDLSPLLGE